MWFIVEFLSLCASWEMFGTVWVKVGVWVTNINRNLKDFYLIFGKQSLCTTIT